MAGKPQTIATGGDTTYTPYVVLARKYRPQSFDDLIGQEVMVRTLRNAFVMDRIAQGYMLTGVRGVGKTTTARILARALNYQLPGGPDKPSLDMPEEGVHCRAIMESRHVDVLEMDAASHTGIDDIREIIEAVRYKPAAARYRVFIIDEVHMLSKAAFNGLLKTLEEPPPHVKFIFATTEIRKVPVTILSRCQRFDLRRVGPAALEARFRHILDLEGQSADDEALALIAKAAEGSVRDGLSLLDQALSLGQGNVSAGIVENMLGVAGYGPTLDLLELIFEGDAAGAIGAMAAMHEAGCDPAMILNDMADSVHALTRIKTVPGAFPSDFGGADRVKATGIATRLTIPKLAVAWQMLLKGMDEVSRAPRPFPAAEMLVIRLCYSSGLPSPADLIGQAKADENDRVPGASSRPASAPRAPVLRAVAGLPDGGGSAVLASTKNLSPENAVAVARQPHAASLSTAEESAPQVALRFSSFEDVVAHAAKVRDIKVKIALEEHVELVKFGQNYVELHLLPAAAPSFAQDLARKLQTWTGERWAVSLSETRGLTAAGQTRRENEARTLDEIKRHPAVKNVMYHFPNAAIKNVSSLED